jgi:integrase/recombinase XerD
MKTAIPYLDAFLDMLVAERAVSPHTRSAYASDLTQAAGVLARRKTDLAKADDADIGAFLKNISALAPKSRARKLSTLRQYYRFLVSEGVRTDDPTAEQDSPKLGRQLPDVISVGEMQRLLEVLDSGTPETIRLNAMMELCYGSGLRASELVKLPLAAFQEKRMALLVRGKGDKERMVPLSATSRTAIARYLEVRKGFIPKGKVSGFLFPSHGREGHISRIRFYQMLKEAAAKAGLNAKKIHPHALRHAFATHLLAGGADLRSLQTMLGHADIGTTQIYTHVVGDHLKATVEAHHPLAKKKKTA